MKPLALAFALGLFFVIAPPVAAGYDLVLACKVKRIPVTAGLLETDLTVKVDETFQRAIITEGVLRETAPEGVMVDEVWLRNIGSDLDSSTG